MDKQLQMKSQQPSKLYNTLLVLGIVFIAFNLRPAITSVGPLIGTIRDDVGFSNWSVALLTSLPLIAFAIMSPLTPRLANRFTNEWALCLGLLMVIIGIGLRSISMVFFLFLGTLSIGLGIAICNVLLPGVIKEKFPLKVAIMTSVYTTGMAIFATIASGVSIPLSDGLGLGWQFALLIWVAPAIIGIIIWIWVALKNNQANNGQMRYMEKQTSNKIWKSKLAWHIALFMGLQSLLFYVMISWLAEILIDFGSAKTTAGFMVSYFQLLGIPVSTIIPILAVKMTSQSKLVLGINILYLIGIALLLLFPTSFIMVIIAVGLSGIASSSNFAMALTFLSIRAENPKESAELSGMAQSIGYILAATGPIIVGFIYDVTKGWTFPLLFLFLLIGLIIIFGVRAGQNKYVFDSVKH